MLMKVCTMLVKVCTMLLKVCTMLLTVCTILSYPETDTSAKEIIKLLLKCQLYTILILCSYMKQFQTNLTLHDVCIIGSTLIVN